RTIRAQVNRVSVDGPRGGPWTVHFVRPGTPANSGARFEGTDVPPLVPSGNVILDVQTITNGHSEVVIPRGADRRVGGLHGNDDTMVGRFPFDPLGRRAFLPRFSRTALLFGTFDYSTLEASDAQDWVRLLRFSAHLPAGQLDVGLDPES